MEPTAGRLVFRIGDAFPVDDPVAIFLMAVSTAPNDLVTVSRWLAGGDDEQPAQFDVSDVERLYLFRLTLSQLYEVRESVKHARKDGAVEDFLADLPQSARQDLARLSDVNTRDAPWAFEAMKHVRNQTNHYGGRWNWDDLEWAMRQAADTDGEIEIRSDHLAGMRLKFADSVANQQLARKWPEHVAEPDAEVDDETTRVRLSALFAAMSEAVAAAQNFAIAAVEAYLEGLSPGMVRVEDPE